MRIWLPYLAAGTGADVSTQYLAEGLRKRGHDVVCQPFSMRFEPAPWLLRAVSPPPDCDAIITNTWNGFAFARRGIPMITVERLFVVDPTLTPYKSRVQATYHRVLIGPYMRRSMKRADVVVAVSQYTADAVARVFSFVRPRVILNAVDTDFFTPPEKPPALSVPQRKGRLLYVGNLSRRKGADLLGPIMHRLGPGYELRFTGRADAATFDCPLPHNMTPLGRLSQEEIRQEYRQADALLFPSRGEGLSRAVMEAMACGLPVVAAKVSSMPEAVDDTVGRLCPVDDVDAFVSAAREVTGGDRENRLRLSRAARQRAKSRFAITRMLDDFERLLSYLRQAG